MDRVALPRGRTPRCVGAAFGVVSWTLISSPLWASVLFPVHWTWAFLAFCVYWLCKSLSLAVYSLVAVRALAVWQRRDWATLGRQLARWRRLHHLVVFPTYREPIEVLEESLRYLCAQDFPLRRVGVLIAFEARDPDAREKARLLQRRFGPHFGQFWTTFHPDRPGEVRGKSSNLAYAVPWAKRLLVEEFGVPIERVVVTICDADSRLHPKYLSALGYQYLTRPHGERCLYQGAVLFHANLSRLAGVFRALNGLYSAMLLARLPRKHTLVTQSTYSLGLAAAARVNYWDVDVIAEDSHMFFKVFFGLGPGVTVHPIYLPVWADAAEGRDHWATLLAHYRQARRWAWGVSDVPYVLWQTLQQRRIPAWLRAVRAGHYIQEHLLWATHWFVLVGGLKFLPWAAPLYAESAQAAILGQAASTVLMACLPCLFVVLWVDQRVRRHHAPRAAPPAAPATAPLDLVHWLAIPLSALAASVMPAVDAHTRLLLGRGLEYQVTEKVAAVRATSSRTSAARGGVPRG